MWFKNENDVELYSIDGYHRPFTTTRNKRRGGGVAIYVTLDLEAELIHTDEIHESVSVKISDSKKRKSQFLVFTVNLPETETSI